MCYRCMYVVVPRANADVVSNGGVLEETSGVEVNKRSCKGHLRILFLVPMCLGEAGAPLAWVLSVDPW